MTNSADLSHSLKPPEGGGGGGTTAAVGLNVTVIGRFL